MWKLLSILSLLLLLLATSMLSRAESAATPTPDLSATLTAVPVVTANAQWKPVVQSFDGVEMALVPPGCFMMGSENGANNEKPVTKICFDQPFWLDKTEVTQAQFKEFGGQAANKTDFSGDKRPVENITWFEARDYCAKRAGRLPTEAEWEYAARGPDGLVYPWGNDFVEANAVYDKNANQRTAEVGSKPAGASWVGALDLSGNVWEWVSSTNKKYPYGAKDGRESNDDTTSRRVLRGGSWFNSLTDDLRGAYRGWIDPSFWAGFDGVRCARSVSS